LSKAAAESLFRRILLLLFIGGVVLGVRLGVALSPDYADPTSSPPLIRRVVAERVREKPAHTDQRLSLWDPVTYLPSYFEPLFDADQKLDGIRVHPVSLTFACGTTEYVYSRDKETLLLEPSRRVEMEPGFRVPRKRLAVFDALTLLGLGAEGYRLSSTVPEFIGFLNRAQLKTPKLLQKVVAAGGSLLSGVGIGLWLGYKNDPRCGEPLFERLLNDKVFWKGVYADYQEAHTCRFHQDLTLEDLKLIEVDKAVERRTCRIVLFREPGISDDVWLNGLRSQEKKSQ